MNEIRSQILGHDIRASAPAVILQRFRWPEEALAYCSTEFARWDVGRAVLGAPDGSLSLARGDQVDFTTLANALDHKKWASLGRLSHVALRIAGQGRAKLLLLDVTATGAARIVTEQVVDLAAKPTELDLGDPAALAGNRLALLIHAETTVRLTGAAWISESTNATNGAVWPEESAAGWTLQRFVWPDASRSDRVSLYAKWPEGPARLGDSEGLPLLRHERVDLITFFNACSHRKWARVTGVRDLALQIEGRGHVRLLVRSVYQDGWSPVIAAVTADLVGGVATISLGDPAQIGGEILGLEVEALSESAYLTSASWTTREPPRRDVRLAAVVTTFKREAAAEAAARRFASETIPGATPGLLELLVVDNGQTLDLPPLRGVRVIPNRNLGGAGGFTRGMIEAQDDGRFTHVLLMDDDASCEPESVWRTMALLARLGDPQGAISGAMLLADHPHIQHEKGGILNTNGRANFTLAPQLSGFDVYNRSNLARNDLVDFSNYGAWWFFAFPIYAMNNYAFPFFVRGDDIDFSISNKFSIHTMNGIASFCDNFGYKLNPPTEYLASRSSIALALMHGTREAQRRAFLREVGIAIRIGLRFDYAGMEAKLDGIKAALHGPLSFAANPAPLSDLGRAKQRAETIKLGVERLADIVPLYHPRSALVRALALLTLGGHLLPKRLQRSDLRHVALAWDARPAGLLRASAVAYGTGLRVEANARSCRKFLKGLARAFYIVVFALFRWRTVAGAYACGAAEFRSRTYWDAALGLASRKQGKPL